MLQDRLGISERRACRYAGQHLSTQRHEPVVAGDDAAHCGIDPGRLSRYERGIHSPAFSPQAVLYSELLAVLQRELLDAALASGDPVQLADCHV
jgi:transcriptional regulator with XRE-family HTH domain